MRRLASRQLFALRTFWTRRVKTLLTRGRWPRIKRERTFERFPFSRVSVKHLEATSCRVEETRRKIIAVTLRIHTAAADHLLKTDSFS
ncbi:hypothetical protein EYF80_055541 [Liparis tanakae]|uniref:Uncharacterized protein n=1 Tax=Liparis tanakae TaxID=230148 RepID=A0A4Z2EZT9_9TELE|nr:hypothetical protein EYF80_055541 [Liparis tanakae]